MDTLESLLETNLSEYAIHDVSAVLKELLRHLPEPLFPYRTYHDVIEILQYRQSPLFRLKELNHLIKQLSEVRRYVIGKILYHLAVISSKSNHNRMNSKSLGGFSKWFKVNGLESERSRKWTVLKVDGRNTRNGMTLKAKDRPDFNWSLSMLKLFSVKIRQQGRAYSSFRTAHFWPESFFVTILKTIPSNYFRSSFASSTSRNAVGSCRCSKSMLRQGYWTTYRTRTQQATKNQRRASSSLCKHFDASETATAHPKNHSEEIRSIEKWKKI